MHIEPTRTPSTRIGPRQAPIEVIGLLNGTVLGEGGDVVPGIADFEQHLLRVLTQFGDVRVNVCRCIREADRRPDHGRRGLAVGAPTVEM